MLIVSMTRDYANDIAEWVYDPPYEIYSMALIVRASPTWELNPR